MAPGLVRLLFSFLLLVHLAGCRADDLPRPSATTPVILISVDTLRADRLPAYGYGGIRTPHIDALRADSILFRRAYSHCPLTVPSHATVFTGQLPAETGIRDNTGYTLAQTSVTIAELLSRNGYDTGAAVSAWVMRRGSGIERGFASWNDEVTDARPGINIAAVQREGMQTVAAAEKWLGTRRSKPVFFFLHLYEPHSPYEPSYDADIERADAAVGRFLDHLKRAGIYDEALIIFFSDHGEGLGDHGEDEHGIFLYREAIEVPLLVKLPGSAKKGSEAGVPVQLSDIFPTVLAQTATRHEAAPASGSRSLLDFLRDDAPRRKIYSETYFPRFHFGWSDLHSLIDGEHHFIQAPQPELYETSDRAEKNNVLEEKRRVYAAMRRDIEPLIRSADAPRPVSPEEAAKLAALGYLGSGAPAEGPLPDPKTQTGTFREIREAFRLFRNGEYEKALTFYQKLLRENPRMLDLWDISARALVRLGRKDEAIAAAKEALKVAPHATHLAILVANLSLEQGRTEDAERHADLALTAQAVEAHEVLARVALARNDPERAEKEARAAIAAAPDNARALVTMARVHHATKNHAAALDHLDRAARIAREKDTALGGLHYLRGDVLARLGRFEEAEAAFREEIRLFPEEPAAYRNLILLHVTQGRLQEATRLIHELEKASPTPPSYVAISETLRVVGDERGARFWVRRGLEKFPDDPSLQRASSGRSGLR